LADDCATGIVVCGLGVDGRGYVLQDCSGKFSPTEWATRAVTAYKQHRADRVIIEKNQGGDMAENTLRMIDKNVPVRAVVASRGKIVRAEPVSALYEQNRVSHVGAFDLLEDQLCTFEAGSAHSPDRLDALVYGLSDLLIGFEAPMNWHPPATGPGRSELYGQVEQGILNNANTTGLPGYSSADKPGGWSHGEGPAAGFDAQFSWSITGAHKRNGAPSRPAWLNPGQTKIAIGFVGIAADPRCACLLGPCIGERPFWDRAPGEALEQFKRRIAAGLEAFGVSEIVWPEIATEEV
jgi:predicted phage terminase large subunit-like protein